MRVNPICRHTPQLSVTHTARIGSRTLSLLCERP